MIKKFYAFGVGVVLGSSMIAAWLLFYQ